MATVRVAPALPRPAATPTTSSQLGTSTGYVSHRDPERIRVDTPVMRGDGSISISMHYIDISQETLVGRFEATWIQPEDLFTVGSTSLSDHPIRPRTNSPAST